MSKWVLFDGSDEQIAEISANDFVLRFNDGKEEIFNGLSKYWLRRFKDVTHFWLIPADPLREMKVRQAMTGQPVWTRRKIENEYFYWLPTTTPDWKIPNAEYSFIEFEKSVDK